MTIQQPIRVKIIFFLSIVKCQNSAPLKIVTIPGDVSKILKYLFIVGFGLAFVLLSWLYVASSAGVFMWNWSKNQGAPQVIREYRWKMRNIDMDVDTLVRETFKLSEKPPEEFEKFKAAAITDLEERGLR